MQLAGRDVTGVPTYELARLGLRRTFQHNAFFGELTLLENAMAAMLREHSTSLGQSHRDAVARGGDAARAEARRPSC